MSKFALTCLAMTAACLYGAFLAPELANGLVQASRAGTGCGFHADSDTHSTHIRTVIPR